VGAERIPTICTAGTSVRGRTPTLYPLFFPLRKIMIAMTRITAITAQLSKIMMDLPKPVLTLSFPQRAF
jgi:hypothetical protein